jgi:ATP-dependent DNA ligase
MRAHVSLLRPGNLSLCESSSSPGNKGGQGITASKMKHLHWVEPRMVCQVKFSEWTRDERLRQPVFLGLHQDKDAMEVVRENASSLPCS